MQVQLSIKELSQYFLPLALWRRMYQLKVLSQCAVWKIQQNKCTASQKTCSAHILFMDSIKRIRQRAIRSKRNMNPFKLIRKCSVQNLRASVFLVRYIIIRTIYFYSLFTDLVSDMVRHQASTLQESFAHTGRRSDFISPCGYYDTEHIQTLFFFTLNRNKRV